MSLAVLSISVGLFGATQILAQQLYQSERLQVLADEIALTAVDALRGLTIGYPCELAAQIAQENMVKLDECRIVGFDVTITVSAKSIGMVHFASATATTS